VINLKVSKSDAEHILREVEPEKAFIFHNGHVVRSLEELSRTIKDISEDVFKHHVTEDRNDFGNWIEHVLKDTTLATAVRQANDRKLIIGIIDHRIKELKSAVEEKLDTKKAVKKIKIIPHGTRDIAQEEKTEKDKIKRKVEEIEKRERKISELEEKMKDSQNMLKQFFTKEFVQGLLIGILFSLLVVLIYIKFS